MKKKNWTKYFEILRPMTCFFGSLTVLIGTLIAVGPSNFKIYLSTGSNVYKLVASMVVFFLVVGSGNTINDVFDYEIDKINRPTRTIVRGAFTKRQVVYYYIFEILVILTLTITGAYFSPNPVFLPLLVLFFLGVSFSYSIFIKQTGLLANLVVGVSGSLGIPFGAFFVLEFADVFGVFEIWLLYITAFLFLVMREIGKDMEDIEGDSKYGVKSVALKWGYKVALIFELVLTFFLFATLIFSMWFFNFKPIFVFMAIISLILISMSDWAFAKNLEEKKWRILASRLSLLSQLFCLLAFIFGALF
jgi:geranylgeranylglycerol-phosphate geranylgeranyltransferase